MATSVPSSSSGMDSGEDGVSPEASERIMSFYRQEKNLQLLCEFLRGSDGVGVKEAIQNDKRVLYLKGEELRDSDRERKREKCPGENGVEGEYRTWEPMPSCVFADVLDFLSFRPHIPRFFSQYCLDGLRNTLHFQVTSRAQ